MSVPCRYVLDVRNNGGGLFPAGVELARMLVESGDIVLIADSQGVMDSYEATGTSIDSKAPVAVLVNKGTASASEVTAYIPNGLHPCSSLITDNQTHIRHALNSYRMDLCSIYLCIANAMTSGVHQRFLTIPRSST